MEALSNLAFMLSLLGLGLVGRVTGVLTPARTDRLTWFAFTLALPALIFTSTHSQPLESVLTPRIVAGVWLVIGLTAVLAFLVHRLVSNPGARSVAIVQSYHANLGFLGLPLVAASFGELATAKASLILGAAALAQVPLTVAVLVTLNDRDESILDEVTSLLTNPVIAALVAGLLFSAFDVGVPGAIVFGLEGLATLALPIALLAVGASLSPEFGTMDAPTVGRVVLLKTLLMPLLAYAVFATMAVPHSTLQAGVLMLAMPTAVSTFVYASELGGDRELASLNVFATTIVSLVLVVGLVPLLS